MTLLVLNRRPIVERIPEWLADAGTGLVLVTARSALAGGVLERVRDRYEEVVAVDDYDGPAVEESVTGLAARHRFTRVLGTTEVDLLRAARIRERLGLPGQGRASALAYRDKFLMKTLTAAAGLPVAAMRRVRSAADLREFAGRAGFPLVVKPVDGGGSVGVRTLAGPAELERLLAGEAAALTGGTAIAESWVGGDCYVVDGLMAAGRVVQSWPVRMGRSNLSSVTSSRSVTGWMLPRGHRVGERARDFVAEVIAALPGPEEVTAFHAELFHTPDDRLVLCEIACRPGGVGHVPAYEHAMGVSLYGATLRGQAGLAPSPRPLVTDPDALAGFCWFTPRPGTLRALPAHCPLEGVRRYVPRAAPGSVHHGARSVADHVAQLLLAGDPAEDLGPRMAEAEAWWEANCLWEETPLQRLP
ncbi:ATP-grasp domain-containing protein [Streptomyces sp. URMC 123]|uniref:ATP-grasp domain-containing protein n=1 Tax=Streptomyces sp. URMC 123 TaxID=3423403 RepID=UPI003F1DE7BD